MSMDLSELQAAYKAVRAEGLNLNMKRGQPSDRDFDLSNEMLMALSAEDYITPSGIDIRNYPGGVAGLPEARALFGSLIGVQPSETIVANNSSLEVMSLVLMWGMLRGLKGSPRPWVQDKPKLIVTVPGYDRHFKLALGLGYELAQVEMQGDGPDVDAIARLAAEDERIKGLYFVPTYSNPTGETISDEKVRRLAGMKTAASDFTIFADDAYRVHHLTDTPHNPLNLLQACREAGHPDRVYIFGSTSKITFASGGIGYIGTSEANVAYLCGLMGLQTIGPNKVAQYQHWKFLTSYPGGVAGLMAEHAKLIAPKFAAVQAVLERELGGTGLATWSQPEGGYFISFDTTKPVADRVVQLANEAGVALTPAGATYPEMRDPHNSNIRLAPTRPAAVEEVGRAMEVVALCVKLASAEFEVGS